MPNVSDESNHIYKTYITQNMYNIKALLPWKIGAILPKVKPGPLWANCPSDVSKKNRGNPTVASIIK